MYIGYACVLYSTKQSTIKAIALKTFLAGGCGQPYIESLQVVVLYISKAASAITTTNRCRTAKVMCAEVEGQKLEPFQNTKLPKSIA